MNQDISDFVKDVRLVKFVLRVMDLPDKTILLERQPGNPRGYAYPIADEYLDQNAETELEKLADNGFLERIFVAKEFGCPQCRTINLSLRLHCPNCDSTRIDRQDIVEHLACGFQGPQTAFTDERCPKCGQALGQLGVDYVRQGSQHVCAACNQIFQAPVQKLSCTRDNISFRVTDAPEINLFNYNLMPRLEEEINKAIDQQKYIAEKVRALGFKVESPAILTGRSGVRQEFHLSAVSGLGFAKTRIVIEFVGNGTVDDVFGLYAKAVDVGAYGVLFAAMPGLSNDAKKVSDSYGMTYVEATDFSSAAERLVKKFAELVETPEERVLEIFGGLGGGKSSEAA